MCIYMYNVNARVDVGIFLSTRMYVHLLTMPKYIYSPVIRQPQFVMLYNILILLTARLKLYYMKLHGMTTPEYYGHRTHEPLSDIHVHECSSTTKIDP